MIRNEKYTGFGMGKGSAYFIEEPGELIYCGDNYALWKPSQPQEETKTAKDARIVNLEGRSQVAEERVKKLEKESQERDKHWAIMVREVDKRDARIVELEDQLEFHRNRTESDDAQIDYWKKSYQEEHQRAKKAEARVNLFQRYHQEDLDEIAALGERAKKAEARANYVVADRDRVEDRKVEALERAETAEARVKELEDELEGSRSLSGEMRKHLTGEQMSQVLKAQGWEEIGYNTDPRDTFTAPDGRVFRVGQRVKDSMKPERIGTIRRFHPLSQGGQTPVVIRMDDGSKPHYNPEFLRRVWDGSEEPDVPVGTVIRGADGLRLGRLPGGWSLYHSGTGNWSGPYEWDDWDHSEEVRPYVEWLPGDDE